MERYREDREYYDRKLKRSGGEMKACMMSLGGIILLIILCWLTSCKSQQQAVNEQEQTRDSLKTEVRYVEKIVKDTVFVEIPAQSVEVVTPDTTSHLETDYAMSDASVIWRDGMMFLSHSLSNKPQKKPVEVEHKEAQKDSIVYRDRDHYHTVNTQTVQEVNVLTWWQKTQIYGLWALIAIYIITHPKKIFSTILRLFRIK